MLRVALGAALGAGLLLACGAPARAEAPPQTILKIATIDRKSVV